MRYVITVLRADKAHKADNGELINSRVPGAAPLARRRLRQGHIMAWRWGGPSQGTGRAFQASRREEDAFVSADFCHRRGNQWGPSVRTSERVNQTGSGCSIRPPPRPSSSLSLNLLDLPRVVRPPLWRIINDALWQRVNICLRCAKRSCPTHF